MRSLLLCVIFCALLYTVTPSTPCDPAAAWNPNPPVFHGASSWFNAQAQGGSATSTGACGWVKNATNDVNVAAYTAETTAAECTLCGDCYNVTGPVGSVVVRVIDYCDTSAGACGVNVAPQWTLNAPAFVTIAGSTGLGRVNVTWYGPVACPLYGNLVYENLSGSNVWYVNYRVSNQRYPLQSVQFSNPNAGGAFFNITRYHGNQWYYNPTSPQGWPFTIKVTDVLGNTVTDTIRNTSANYAFTGTGGNFPDPTPSNSPSYRSLSPSTSFSNSISHTSTASLSNSISHTSTASLSKSISHTSTASLSKSISHTSTASLSPSTSHKVALKTAVVTFPAISGQSVNSNSDLINAASIATGVPASQISVANSSSTGQRDLPPTQLIIEGLDDTKAALVQDPNNWVDSFNQVAGTDITPSAVRVQVTTPASSESMHVSSSTSSGSSHRSWLLFV